MQSFYTIHESSGTINTAMGTMHTLRRSAKLHTKLQRIILLRDLLMEAKEDPLNFHKWDLIEEFIQAQRLSYEDMLLVQMLESLPAVIWDKVKLKATLGQELSKALVEECVTDLNFRIDGSPMPDLTPRGQRESEVKKYKKMIADLRKQKDMLEQMLPAPMPRLQQLNLPSRVEPCKICLKLHDGACPWAESRCRWCCQLHAEDHPIFGKCTRAKHKVTKFTTEDGRAVVDVAYANTGKGISYTTKARDHLTPRLMKFGARPKTRSVILLPQIGENFHG